MLIQDGGGNVNGLEEKKIEPSTRTGEVAAGCGMQCQMGGKPLRILLKRGGRRT